MEKQTLNFVTELYVRRQLPHHYKEITNNLSDKKIFENHYKESENIDVLIVEDLPRYLTIERQGLPKNIKSLLVKTYPGFLIDFQNVKSLPEYLKQRFGKTSRYKLKREQRKLEDCFDITYKMYYGEMSEGEYNFIFEEFYRLLEIRSLEKGIKDNVNFAYKAEYFTRVRPMILEKKASFFVIYNGKNPIDICLNFHVKNTIFQYIRTYDIAYSKFNTGYTDLMKQIEWCIENKIDSISFSKGDFYWKRRWCNTVYDYDYELFFNKYSLKSKFVVYKLKYKSNARQFLREKGVIRKYHEFRDSRHRRLKSKKTFKSFKINISKYEGEYDILDHLKINYHLFEFNLLRKSVYEFLYATDEKEKDIVVYRSNGSAAKYIVIGKHNIAELSM